MEISLLLRMVIGFPLIGAVLLLIFGASMPKKTAGAIGCASVGASLIAAIGATALDGGNAFGAEVYKWIGVSGLQVPIGLYFDRLSLVMTLVVTFVGFMIHLYAAQSMYEEDGYSRFFGYMNLFVAAMLTLVLADNLLLMYLGWEGVGLCSYLLIGFWYKEKKNGYAAQKAFIVTRVGDTAMAIGLFVIFLQLGTLNIQSAAGQASRFWAVGGSTVTLVAFLLLAGAVGKSAQIPLQTWLPDAMAGPTPVSALIHAATMVTAGVYLIARMHTIFEMAPVAQTAVAVIGAVTLFYSGFSALTQRDIKRVLAYSTISQIGYMFLALGVGAWTAAIFHFVTHAFFKSLLFLSAGVVIDAMQEDHDLFHMGGLARRLPVAFWTFLIGAASLSALPLVTAGFYSKDAIIWASWASERGGLWFWLASASGALITAAYSFRALFLAFLGPERREIAKYPGTLMKTSLIVLAFFSLTSGFIAMPAYIGGAETFLRFMSGVLPETPFSPTRGGQDLEMLMAVISVLLGLAGIYASAVYMSKPGLSEAVDRSGAMKAVHAFFRSGWGFDALYDRVFVRPFKALAYMNRKDAVDKLYTGLAWLVGSGNRLASRTQTGGMRDYVAGMALGAVVLIGIAILILTRR